MATKLKDLEIDDAHATAVLEKAIEYESFDQDMPDSKRARIKAATEQITMMVDAWVNDGVTPENDDEEVAAVGQAIEEIFEIVGVEIDDEGEVSYVEPAELEEGEGEDDTQGGDDDEAAVDINDIIAEYDDLSAASKVKAIKALELDMDDDDDYNTAVALYEYEESQDQPSSRVLSYLDDVIPPEDEGAAEEEPAAEDDDDEGAEAAGEGEWEQPWDKYDKQTAVEVKKQLDKLLAREEMTEEMLQYVIDYENGREKPPPRKRIIDYATKLMGELEGGEPAEEEPPARAARPSAATRMRGSSRRRGARAADPDDQEDADEAVARDDAREGRRGRRAAKEPANGVIVLTREQILTALDSGEVEIEI